MKTTDRKKTKNRTGGKEKRPGEAKHGLPTYDRVVESSDRKWRLALAPNETIVVAEDALLLQMAVQNPGPAVFEVTVENNEPVVLLPGKMALINAYGKITIVNYDDYAGTAEMEFFPRRNHNAAGL